MWCFAIISVCDFFKAGCTQNVSSPTFFDIFGWNLQDSLDISLGPYVTTWHFGKIFAALTTPIFPKQSGLSPENGRGQGCENFSKISNSNIRSQWHIKAILKISAENIKKYGRRYILSASRFEKIANWDNRKTPQFLRFFALYNHILKDIDL